MIPKINLLLDLLPLPGQSRFDVMLNYGKNPISLEASKNQEAQRIYDRIQGYYEENNPNIVIPKEYYQMIEKLFNPIPKWYCEKIKKILNPIIEYICIDKGNNNSSFLDIDKLCDSENDCLEGKLVPLKCIIEKVLVPGLYNNNPPILDSAEIFDYFMSRIWHNEDLKYCVKKDENLKKHLYEFDERKIKLFKESISQHLAGSNSEKTKINYNTYRLISEVIGENGKNFLEKNNIIPDEEDLWII